MFARIRERVRDDDTRGCKDVSISLRRAGARGPTKLSFIGGRR